MNALAVRVLERAAKALRAGAFRAPTNLWCVSQNPTYRLRTGNAATSPGREKLHRSPLFSLLRCERHLPSAPVPRACLLPAPSPPVYALRRRRRKCTATAVVCRVGRCARSRRVALAPARAAARYRSSARRSRAQRQRRCLPAEPRARQTVRAATRVLRPPRAVRRRRAEQ